MNEDKHRTFISYPRKNAEFALKLARELKTAGFDVWFDQLDIPAGARWDDEVQRALAECGIFLVILTPEAIESENVKDEIGYAIDSRKRILPVLLKPCNIPFRLRRFHYVDFTMLDYDLGIETAEKLLTSLINESTIPKRVQIQPQESGPMSEDSSQQDGNMRVKIQDQQTASQTEGEKNDVVEKPAIKIQKDYRNQANSDHPATLIYLVDISGSMSATMQDGKTRIEVAKNAIQVAYAQMIQRSMRQGKIHPRYRVGMIAYSDKIYDVYGKLGSIISIDQLKNEGIPAITPQKSTNMAKAFHYAEKLIKEDLQKWSRKWLEECPPPMVINITDCEFDEEQAQDPVEFAQRLQQISVRDGNVLVENIFITDQISAPASPQDWQGYQFGDKTGNSYGDKLLAMSSPIPSTYAQILREQAGIKIREGKAMMFPGISREFIKFGFVMSIVTGSQIAQASRPRTS
jgi:Mg-chelatase subunit ChlD